MKKVLLVICTIALMFGVFFAADIEPAQAASNIKVTVDGQVVNTGSAKPFVDSHNRVMVPMRALSNALGTQIGVEYFY